MTIADSKRTTDTSTKTKHTAEPNEPSTSKLSTQKTATILRRPVAVQTSTETTTSKPDAATKPKPTYEKRMRELAPVVRLRRKLTANTKRLSKVSGEVQGWANAPSELRDAAVSVATALATLLAVATTLPDDFKPERIRKGGAQRVVPGAKVTIREKFAERYDGVIGPEERTNLDVLTVARGGLVSVATVTGARLVLPRSHVTKASAT